MADSLVPDDYEYIGRVKSSGYGTGEGPVRSNTVIYYKIYAPEDKYLLKDIVLIVERRLSGHSVWKCGSDNLKESGEYYVSAVSYDDFDKDLLALIVEAGYPKQDYSFTPTGARHCQGNILRFAFTGTQFDGMRNSQNDHSSYETNPLKDSDPIGAYFERIDNLDQPESMEENVNPMVEGLVQKSRGETLKTLPGSRANPPAPTPPKGKPDTSHFGN